MKGIGSYLSVCLCFCLPLYADAFHEGQALVSGKARVDSRYTLGLPMLENPPETRYTNTAEIAAALDQKKSSDDAFQQLKKANEERERYDVYLEDTYHTKTVDTLKEALGDHQMNTSTAQNSVFKTCFKSGESYSRTCRRQRIIEIKVTPEVWATNPRFCLGHWNRWGTSKSHCGGCRGGDSYIAQHKKVDITRDEWVGCEELEQLHDQGKAEIVSETLGPFNEARIIEGETITKDYWETTRTYALNISTYDDCDKLRAIGCTYQYGVCDTYGRGMAGEKICLRYKRTYRCQLSSETTVSGRPDLTLTLPPVQTSVANHNMVKALSQMEAMRQMAAHMEGNVANLRIFRGDAKRCTTNFGGSFKDCCRSTGGTGTRLHLATACTAEENQLADARAQKRCVFVGARQKKKTLGMNVSKEYVYCCFSNKLGLAIQQGARSQLGRTFGSAADPHCEGLTPDELSNVDFEQLDLSETFADIAASAAKATRDVQIDLSQKQRQFQRPKELDSVKVNQQKHKRVYTDLGEGRRESHDLTY